MVDSSPRGSYPSPRGCGTWEVEPKSQPETSLRRTKWGPPVELTLPVGT